MKLGREDGRRRFSNDGVHDWQVPFKKKIIPQLNIRASSSAKNSAISDMPQKRALIILTTLRPRDGEDRAMLGRSINETLEKTIESRLRKEKNVVRYSWVALERQVRAKESQEARCVRLENDGDRDRKRKRMRMRKRKRAT